MAIPHADDEGSARPINGQDLPFALDMMKRIAFVRAFEAKALALSQSQPPAIVGSVHLCAGQEAVALGAMAALRSDDAVVATYRGHAWAIACGLDPEAVMAELCHRSGGINSGRAGSPYMMAPDQRFYGENSIVGAGVPIATGIAMAEVAAGSGRVAVVTIGDGAMSQGSVHEALVFAAARSLPMILVVENNDWSELTPTRSLLRIDRLAQRARGYGIPGATIDGTDPVDVRDTIAAAAEHARSGHGPSLIEARVPRLWGHYNRDIEHYRPKDDKRDAEARDPMLVIRRRLLASGVSEAEIDAAIAEETAAVDALAERALASPEPSPAAVTHNVIAPPGEARDSAASPTTREITYIEAVNAALRDVLERDPSTVVYGEDVGKSGGIFAAARYLQRDFGEARVFDTPIAESAILGSAVGAAMAGLKPVVEIMWADFMLVALDQLINQAANVRYVTGGRTSVPMVVRTQQGATPGSCAQHSQSLEALLAHIPGLKVALAATPQDAYDLLRAAHADPDPCVVIEARGLYQTKAPVEIDGRIQPAFGAKRHREGSAATIVTWGTMLREAVAAADRLAAEGIAVTVLDLRWLNPLDEAALAAAVRAGGGRVVVVHEAVRTGGFGAEIVARIHELCGPELTAPVKRITTPDIRMPASPVLQRALLPSADAICAAVRALAQPQETATT